LKTYRLVFFQIINKVCCNHISMWDIFPFLSIKNYNVLIDKGFFESSYFAKIMIQFIGGIPLQRNLESKEYDKKQVMKVLENNNNGLLFFPEGWDTNGKGTLIYQKFLFSLQKPILVCSLKSRVPFLPIRTGKLGTSVFQEMLWLFYSPMYIFDLEFIQVVENLIDENEYDFSKRVQNITSNHLSIVSTNYSFKDALELRKKFV
jgi:1-acyl-sn-glycerol-3-phosphate acyltransferase